VAASARIPSPLTRVAVVPRRRRPVGAAQL
jgi:hypothetical protein